MLLRRASPSGPSRENSTPRNFQAGSPVSGVTAAASNALRTGVRPPRLVGQVSDLPVQEVSDSVCLTGLRLTKNKSANWPPEEAATVRSET